MKSSEYDELSKDYWKLTEQHYNMKAAYEMQIEKLKEENRRLEDECKGRGYWLIALVAMLIFSVVLGFFIR